MGKIRLPFIDSDLLYRGALKGRFDCTQLIAADASNPPDYCDLCDWENRCLSVDNGHWFFLWFSQLYTQC